MTALHALTAPFDEDQDEDEPNTYTCPECDTDEFMRRIWGTYWEDHTVRLREDGRVTNEDWNEVDRQTDDGDPWFCIHGHALPDDLNDHLYVNT